jgi:hypothetical protein
MLLFGNNSVEQTIEIVQTIINYNGGSVPFNFGSGAGGLPIKRIIFRDSHVNHTGSNQYLTNNQPFVTPIIEVYNSWFSKPFHPGNYIIGDGDLVRPLPAATSVSRRGREQNIETTNNTPQNICSIQVPDNCTILAQAEVTAIRADSGKRYVARLERGFFRAGSGGSLGTTTINAFEDFNSTVAADLVWNSVDNAVEIQVIGQTGTTIRWKANLSLTINRN